MTEQSGGAANPLWDPFGVWRELTRQSTEQGFIPMHSLGSQTPLQMVVDAARSRLVGRTLTWMVAGAPLKFDLDDFDLKADGLLLAAGQADEIRVIASSLSWREHEISSARAIVHNVHTRSGRRPQLVGAPIDLVVHLPARYVSDRVTKRVPWLRLEVTESGDVRARHTTRSRWGWVQVSLETQGGRIVARPQAWTRGGRSLSLSQRIPAFPIALDLPPDIRVTRLEVLPGELALHLRVDERHIDYKQALSFLSTGESAEISD